MQRLPRIASTLILLLSLLSNSALAQQELIIEDDWERETTPEPMPEQTLNDRVLVIHNSNVPESLDVANHYRARRGISSANLLGISFNNDQEISWSEYLSVKSAVRDKLNALGKRWILYIVFSYRTPYRIGDVPTNTTNYSCSSDPRCNRGTSLDQFIADVWDETGIFDARAGVERQSGNSYYAPSQSKANQYQPFISLADFRSQNTSSTTYSVWRLDGPTADIARGLVDKAIAAETNGLQGVAYFDKNVGGMYPQPDETGGTLRGNWDIYRAAEFAREAGFSVHEDNFEQQFGTAPARLRADNAALYAGLYNFGQYNDAFTWNTGAIGFDFNSDAAAGFRYGTRWSGGALQRGITITGGAIDEPQAPLFFKFDGIFRNLFEGANVGDAVLRNTPALKWRLVNIGDPLYRPFAGRSFPPQPAPLPGGWSTADIDSAPANVGNYNGNFAVRSTGRSLYGSTDSCTYTHQSLNGDGQIVARVGRTEHTGEDAFAGVMMRENTGANSRHISITIDGTGQLQTRVRANPGDFVGGGLVQNIGAYYEHPYPQWLKIERRGNTFTGYKSPDGIVWTQIISQTISMSSGALAGLVTTSGNASIVNEAFYDQAQVSAFSSEKCYRERWYYDDSTGEWHYLTICDSPIVIDVAGDGFNLTDAMNGVRFDLNSNGAAERLAWTSSASDDAWLALDRNGNGTIDSGAELFGNYTLQPSSPEPNGFIALAEFDKFQYGGNRDGMITEADRVFANLRLWQDTNHNGVSEANELHTLESLGVMRLDLDFRESRRRDRHGNEFRYRARIRDVRGAHIGQWAWDVFLRVAPE